MLPAGDRRWAEALAAFDEVVELEGPARQARLQVIGSTDPELQLAIERLLAADSRAGAILVHLDGDPGDDTMDGDPLQLVGRTVSHFRIIEAIARGGMGVVYRAEDIRLERPVALKVPFAARYFDPAAKQRFRQEARLAGGLDHANLCPVYETGETADGDLFYTMPLYEGETLKARLAREGRLPLAQALAVAAQLAHGLGAAHQGGIVHRDLKPANVMLLPDGAVKILDFGLAKASDLTLTGSWARLGTIAYMAPEQVQGHKVDGRADLWALGVVLYEMVTGTRPFGGGHEIGVAHAILHQPAPRASALRDDLSAELDDLIDTCLRKDPAERYSSAEELAEALGRIRPDEGARLRRRLRRAGVLLARHPRWRTSVIVATVVLVLAAAAGLTRRGMTSPPAPVSLAVLPFDRVGDSAVTDYLAVGLSDGIGTELRQLHGVIVPGYVSTAGYRQARRSPQQIGAEQKVGAVLRGRIQRQDDRVLLAAQLLRTEDGKRLWDGRYERPVSQIQEIQRDIVRATAATLRIRPTGAERVRLDQLATTDPGAYDTYLQGRAVELAGQRSKGWSPIPDEDVRRAVALYSRARDLDPGFAMARARLALMHAASARTFDTTDGRREQARVEAEAALRRRPGLAEAREALASYWILKGNAAKAIEELGLAVATYPNDATLRVALGDALSQGGRLDEAVGEYAHAMRLEPGNLMAAISAAMAYNWLRRREEAMQAFDHAIALAPDNYEIQMIKGQAYLRWKGTPDTLADIMEHIPPEWDPGGAATYSRYTALWIQRRYADALAALARARSELYSDGALYEPFPLLRARLYQAMGDRQMARATFNTARRIIGDSVAADPTDPRRRIALGFAYAGLGRTTEAVREARRALELAPTAAVVMGGAAEVFTQAGKSDEALKLLELLFSMPAGRTVTAALLRVWPGFDPLRKDPRFEELLNRFAATR
ncbi:MAG TPA: protein kinase [Gemmatimonadales bacterium]|nr:protein kinase [Gemmatimonadales bacterium]